MLGFLISTVVCVSPATVVCMDTDTLVRQKRQCDIHPLPLFSGEVKVCFPQWGHSALLVIILWLGSCPISSTNCARHHFPKKPPIWSVRTCQKSRYEQHRDDRVPIRRHTYGLSWRSAAHPLRIRPSAAQELSRRFMPSRLGAGGVR
jgi:hypothetical protein